MASTPPVIGAPASVARQIEKTGLEAAKPPNQKIESKYAVQEIEAYIVIRDGLLAEAEKGATCELLRRLSTANDFVENCLGPARSPYDAQFLPDLDAVRERQRCETIKIRIGQLSSRQ